MGFFNKISFKMPFKKQIMIILILTGLLGTVTIGVSVYFFEMNQIKRNAEYLILNTTRQTANMFNDKLEMIFNQYKVFNDSTAIWRLVNNRYQEEESVQEYQDIIKSYNHMKEIYSSNSGVMDSLYLETVHGTKIQVYKDMIYDKSSINIKELFSDNYDGSYGYTWINTHVDKVYSTKMPREVISLIQEFKNSSNEKAGIMVLNMKSKYFESLLNQVKISEHGYAMLISQDGYMVPKDIGQPYSLSEKQMDYIRTHLNGEGNIDVVNKEFGEHLSVYYSPLHINNWSLVSVVPESDLGNSSDNFLYVLVIILVFILVITLVLSNLYASFISKPIEQLSEQVILFQTNPNVEFHVDAGYEIGTLADGLSNLKKSVEELLKQVREEQEQKAKLELLVMQAQIKPHFLYNTLSSIKYLSDMSDNDTASKMCTALSKFYELGLSNGKHLITVKEEIEHIHNYLMIQKYRYKDRFDYSINIAEDIMDIKLLKLSLQPIVENAIYHGIKNKEDFGMIIISGYREENKIILAVYDDGVGMREDELNKLIHTIEHDSIDEASNSFGLRNVNKRLKLFFGEEVEMIFESTKDVYTQVKIGIPIMQEA